MCTRPVTDWGKLVKRARNLWLATGGAGLLYVVVNICAHVMKPDARLPHQVNTMILVILGAAFICSFLAWLELRASARADYRYRVIKMALVELGASVNDNTGEIRRYVTGDPRPTIDPSTAAMLNRIDREMGQQWRRPGPLTQ
jgi:hypothetical protein